MGIVIALVAVKRANRRSLPKIDQLAAAVPGDETDRRAAQSRLAVAVTGILLMGGSAYLWLAVPATIARPGAAAEIEEAGGADRGPPTVADRAPESAAPLSTIKLNDVVD